MKEDKAYIGDEKNIKDYLHLYLGCEVQCTNEQRHSDNEYFGKVSEVHPLLLDKYCNGNWKPILRPLSDMSEEDEEATGLNATYEYGHHTFTPQEFIYFLSKGFDLFSLIESGLAIDKTTLNKQS